MFTLYSYYDLSLIAQMLSILFRVVAAIYFGLIIKRALVLVGIKNGLIVLRKMLLLSSVIMLLVTMVSIFLIAVRPFLSRELFSLSTDGLTVVNGLGFLFLGYIQYKIQTFQYSPRQLDLHRKIEVIEKREDTQLENREMARVKVNADRRQVTQDRKDKKII